MQHLRSRQRRRHRAVFPPEQHHRREFLGPRRAPRNQRVGRVADGRQHRRLVRRGGGEQSHGLGLVRSERERTAPGQHRVEDISRLAG